MTKAINELCLKIVEFVEENPYCTRIDVAQAVSKGKSIQFAWDSVKHLFEYKQTNGRSPVTYKRNKIAYSRDATKYMKSRSREPSLATVQLSKQMAELIRLNNGITGADIRSTLNINTTTFKRASKLLKCDRKRTFGRGTGYWQLGTAPETIRAVRVQNVVNYPARTPIYKGAVLTKWQGGNPFAQMAA